MNKTFLMSYRLVISTVLFVGIGLVFLSLSMTQSNFDAISLRAATGERQKKNSNISDSLIDQQKLSGMANQEIKNWDTINFLDKVIPDSVKTGKNSVEVISKHVNIMQISVFYREAIPLPGIEKSNQTILLLHGQAFKSETWLDLGTINILCAMGHRVIAIDLPGFGLTPETLSESKESFLRDFIDALHLKNLVIVSPSMSGTYSIPFMISNWKSVSGYIPVAPVKSELIKSHVKEIKTPTLIIYGEYDTSIGHTSRDNLSGLLNSQVFMLPKSRHPAYLDEPDMFHQLLYNFLLVLKDYENRSN